MELCNAPMYAEAIGENSRDVHSDTNEMSFTISHLFFLFYPDCMPTACPENFSIHFLPHPSAPIVIEIEENDYIIPTYFFFLLLLLDK